MGLILDWNIENVHPSITILSIGPQGINESANLRFLQRLSIIFGFRRDCPCRNQEITDSVGGSQNWRTVSAGSVNWQTGLYPVRTIQIQYFHGEETRYFYPWSLASAETVPDLLLPAETTIHEKWLPPETVPVILLPSETLSRKLNHTDSLCRKLVTKHNSLGRKQEITVSAEAKYDG